MMTNNRSQSEKSEEESLATKTAVQEQRIESLCNKVDAVNDKLDDLNGSVERLEDKQRDFLLATNKNQQMAKQNKEEMTRHKKNVKWVLSLVVGIATFLSTIFTAFINKLI